MLLFLFFLIVPGQSVTHLSCLNSWAARSSSWMFLVTCSVFIMTSSVHGKVGSGSHASPPPPPPPSSESPRPSSSLLRPVLTRGTRPLKRNQSLGINPLPSTRDPHEQLSAGLIKPLCVWPQFTDVKSHQRTWSSNVRGPVAPRGASHLSEKSQVCVLS